MSESNGQAEVTNSHTVPEVQAPVVSNDTNAHAAAQAEEPEITRINGPLGIGSASLAGKVALVTGSGMCYLNFKHKAATYSKQDEASAEKWLSSLGEEEPKSSSTTPTPPRQLMKS